MPEIDLYPREWRPNIRPPSFGSPIDFGPSIAPKRHKEANPLIWGASLAIFAAIVATIASISHQLGSSQTVWGMAMGCYFWGDTAARVKNWLGTKMFNAMMRRAR